MFTINLIVILQRPRAAATIEHPRKNCVRNVKFRPFNALHNASTFLISYAVSLAFVEA
jgi:hypothetical protein